MGIFDSLRNKYVIAPLADYLIDKGTKDADGLSKTMSDGGVLSPGIQRFATDYNSAAAMAHRRSPQSSVDFSTLRQFSVTNEIVRACINARKRQISQLEWDIVAAKPEDKTNYSKQQDEVKAFFKEIGGYKTRFRELVDTAIEDLLVLDAVALYKQRNMKGDLLSLLPIDAATIQLRVDDMGNTPEPPEVAYKQIIRGEVVAEMTADEMIYEMMNPRTTTPYGLAPIESLILIISSMLRSELYNLQYLSEGNIPEGIVTLPESWSAPMIKEFRETWDAYLAGNTAATTRLSFMPGGSGSGYIPTKKHDDMAFREFNTWLMEVICALFDVQPQEIGFTDHSSTRANSKEQGDITQRKGMLPLANLLTEVFNDVIQQDLGFPDLQFKYMGLEDRDQLLEAQVQQIQVETGIRTIDEVRKDELGLDPLPGGLGAEAIVSGQTQSLKSIIDPPDPGPLPVAPGAAPAATVDGNGKPLPDVPDPEAKPATKADHIAISGELHRFRTYAIKRLKDGKSLRPFVSEVLPAATVEELNAQLAKCTGPQEARAIFSDFMKESQIEYLADVQELRRDLAKVLAA